LVSYKITGKNAELKPFVSVRNEGYSISNFKNIETHIFTVWRYIYFFMAAVECRYKNYRRISFPNSYGVYFMNIKWSNLVLHKTKYSGEFLNFLMRQFGI